MPKSSVGAKKKPPLPLSELVDVVGRNFFFVFAPTPITPTFFFPHFCAGFGVLCRRTECGEETEEQSAAVWSSSCCLPDQRGNKRGLPGPTLLWRCLTDSQQLVPYSPPCRGQAAGLQGPEVTYRHWTGGRGEKVLDGRVNRGRDVYVCFFCCVCCFGVLV